MKKSCWSVLVAFVALFASASSHAAIAPVTLVQTNDLGYYNNHIGNLLDLTNGGNTDSGYFPTTNDAHAVFATAPDLSAASSVLGNWLTDPQHLSSSWTSTPIAVPSQWAVSTEVAVMYQFNTGGATNVVAQFGVDNGIFVWLDGKYLFGARDPGTVVLGEYTVNVGNLSAGTHYLQLLLEDHGVTNGYAVNVSADTFIPAVPEPENDAMLLAGLGLMGFIARRRVKKLNRFLSAER